MKQTSDGVTLFFPENIPQDNISGVITFQRLSNQKLDFTEEINLTDHKQFIPETKIVPGKWLVRIEWKNEDEEYLYKDSWFF